MFKLKKNRIEQIKYIFYIIVGINLLIYGSFFIIKLQTGREYTNAVITQIVHNDGYYGKDFVYLQYKVNGKKYAGLIRSNSPYYQAGNELNVSYYKYNPGKVSTISDFFPYIAIVLLAFVFLGFGIVPILVMVNKYKLKEKGTLVMGKYDSTLSNEEGMVNAVIPYNIICTWTNPKDEIEYKFKSDNFWTNPEKMIQESKIHKFPIYVDMNNLKKYYFDTTELEEFASHLKEKNKTNELK